MVIVGIVLGGMVWSVMGLILSIPLLAIIKVILNHIESLQPLGFALEERDISTDNSKHETIKEWLKEKVIEKIVSLKINNVNPVFCG